DLETLRRRLDGLRRESSAELTSWHRVQLSRHPRRPHVQDFIELIFSDFSPLHGDRRFADDPAMIGGMARFHGEPCIILGTQKGRDTEQKLFRNFGMPKPEGYRKALRLMQLAQKFDRPIFIFIDTAGAYPGIGAEERGQAEAIAQNLREMARLTVPVLVTITGEGGSGGALGIGIGDRVYMLEHAYYSVISPEGCAAILWKDQSRVEDAANALKITSSHLKRLGIVDEVIPEPEGGAHNDPEQTAASVDRQLKEGLKALKSLSAEQLVLQRSRRFRVLGDASPLSDPPPDSVSRP
ncbi:MAG: acetyl-CoA carboxylase carboxyltransferase subunit alpha, partial [Acidobacteriota bacterium]|nr:acetyl-CoA carboxylase carboxyltransferase subunit alpha [Acidobacteriota bacterium]